MGAIRVFWADMFTPPWKDVENESKFMQLLLWSFGWIWSIMGLILGAFIVTPILTRFGLMNTPYAGWLTYGVVALSGLVIQLISYGIWSLLFLFISIVPIVVSLGKVFPPEDYPSYSWNIITPGVALLTLGGESYVIYRFIQTQNLAQGTATAYALGGLVVKALIFPAIKGFFVGIVTKRIFAWLRGEDSKA
jgi:hypothetical protein